MDTRWKGHLRTGEAITGVSCPHKFCEGRIVYSGNYFCEFSVGVQKEEDATCNFILEQDEWEMIGDRSVLTHPASPLHKRVWKAIQLDVFGREIE